MFLSRNKIIQFVYSQRVFAQRPGCNLAMHNPGCDVRVVRSDLAPADVALMCRYTDKGQKLPTEGLDACNFHSESTSYE